jgi:hypothetical protein
LQRGVAAVLLLSEVLEQGVAHALALAHDDAEVTLDQARIQLALACGTLDPWRFSGA